MRNVEWIESIIKDGRYAGMHRLDMMLPIADSNIRFYLHYASDNPSDVTAIITVMRYKHSDHFTIMQYDNPLEVAMDTMEMVMQKFRRNYAPVIPENAVELKGVLAGLLFDCKANGSFGPKPWNSTVWWLKDIAGVSR